MPDDTNLPQPDQTDAIVSAEIVAATPQMPHGDKWGELPTPERQQWLLGQLAAWSAEADHGTRRGPFDIRDTFLESV